MNVQFPKVLLVKIHSFSRHWHTTQFQSEGTTSQCLSLFVYFIASRFNIILQKKEGGGNTEIRSYLIRKYQAKQVNLERGREMWKQAGIVVVFTFGVFEICEAFFVKWVCSNSLKLRKKKKVRVGSGYPQLQGDLAESRVGVQAGRVRNEYQIRVGLETTRSKPTHGRPCVI